MQQFIKKLPDNITNQNNDLFDSVLLDHTFI